MLSKAHLKRSVQTGVRFFGAGHGAVAMPAADQKFINTTAEEKKFMILNGLESTAPLVPVFRNKYRHLNDKSIFHHEHPFSGYEDGHGIEEEHGLFDEPYGYELGDDPFDTSGKTHYPLLLIALGFFALAHFSFAHFRFDGRKQGEAMWHQKLTANYIEDEIRAIREEDAAVRHGE